MKTSRCIRIQRRIRKQGDNDFEQIFKSLDEKQLLKISETQYFSQKSKKQYPVQVDYNYTSFFLVGFFWFYVSQVFITLSNGEHHLFILHYQTEALDNVTAIYTIYIQ